MLRTLKRVSEIIDNSMSFYLYSSFVCAECFLIDADSVVVDGDQNFCLKEKLWLFKVTPLISPIFTDHFPLYSPRLHCFRVFSASFALLELI